MNSSRQSLRSSLVIVGTAIPLIAHAWYPYPDTYTAWQAERPFLIAGLHNSVPTDRLPERMARMRAAGINTFSWSKPWNAKHFYEAASEAGLEWAGWLKPGNADLDDDFMRIPGCSFLQVGDEPNREDELIEIGETVEAVRNRYPHIPVFCNLSIAGVDHHRYVELVNPDLFMFDHYPLQRNGETQDHYLYNLNWGRQTAMTYKLPYWMYLQAWGRVEEKPTYAYRIPDEADLRFLVFTFLAHGGTGITWFHYYGHPESMVVDTGVKNPARTEEPHIYENTVMSRAWYAAQDVSPEIQNLANALLNLRPKDHVMYAGNPVLWKDVKPTYSEHNPDPPIKNHAFEPRGALKNVDIVEQDEMGVLVSLFDDEAGEEYFMVVNLEHGADLDKIDCRRTLVLTFDDSVETIERLNRLSGKVEVLRTFPASTGIRRLTLRLEGGTGDLFKWSNGNPWAMR